MTIPSTVQEPASATELPSSLVGLGPLYWQALTHRSYIEERGNSELSYQRLEFLGDALLRMLAAEELFRRSPDADEGELSKRIAALVSAGSLAETPLSHALEALVRLGRGERQVLARSHGDRRINLRSDLFEAWLGATYLDRGLDAARELVLRQLKEGFTGSLSAAKVADPKTTLAEACQRLWKRVPTYFEQRREGQDHALTFYFGVSIPSDPTHSYFGCGSSKKNAQAEAAREALAARAQWDPDNS